MKPRLVLYPTVLLVLAVSAFFALFQNFSIWEDSSFCIYALNHYLETGSMQDIGFPYGPVYFWLYALSSLFVGVLTETSIRFIALLIWLGGAFLLALLVDRMTGNYWLGLSTLVATSRGLSLMVIEPGLANSLVFLLTTLCLACWILPKKPQFFLTGFLACLVIFIKANLGIYLTASIGLLAMTSLKNRWPRYLWSSCMLLGPIAVMRHNSDIPMLAAILICILQVVISVHRMPSSADLSGSWWKTSKGFLSALALCFLGAKLEGFSFSSLTYRLLGQHLNLGKEFYIASELGTLVIVCVLAGVALSLLSEKCPRYAAWFLPALGTLGILLQRSPATIWDRDSYAFIYILGFGLFWLLKPSDHRCLLLLSVGCLQVLGAYPVCGAQFSLGSIYLLTAAFLVNPPPAPSKQRWLPPILFVLLSLSAISMTHTLATGYQKKVPSTLAGIDSRLRFHEGQWLIREWVLYNLLENAQSVVTIPGLFSFPNWTKLPAAQSQIVSTFPYNLAPEELEDSFQIARQSKGAVTVYQPGCCQFWNKSKVVIPQMEEYLASLVPLVNRFDFHLLLPAKDLQTFRLVGIWISRQDPQETVLSFRLPENGPVPTIFRLEEFLSREQIPATFLDGQAILKTADLHEKTIFRAFDDSGKLLYRFPVLEVSEQFGEVLGVQKQSPKL